MPSIWIWKGLHAALPQHSPVKVLKIASVNTLSKVCKDVATVREHQQVQSFYDESWLSRNHEFCTVSMSHCRFKTSSLPNAIIWLLPLWISNSRSLSLPELRDHSLVQALLYVVAPDKKDEMILNDNIYYIYKYYTNYTNNKCWKCWQRKTDEGLRDRCSKRQLQGLEH